MGVMQMIGGRNKRPIFRLRREARGRRTYEWDHHFQLIMLNVS